MRTPSARQLTPSSDLQQLRTHKLEAERDNGFQRVFGTLLPQQQAEAVRMLQGLRGRGGGGGGTTATTTATAVLDMSADEREKRQRVSRMMTMSQKKHNADVDSFPKPHTRAQTLDLPRSTTASASSSSASSSSSSSVTRQTSTTIDTTTTTTNTNSFHNIMPPPPDHPPSSSHHSILLPPPLFSPSEIARQRWSAAGLDYTRVERAPQYDINDKTSTALITPPNNNNNNNNNKNNKVKHNQILPDRLEMTKVEGVGTLISVTCPHCHGHLTLVKQTAKLDNYHCPYMQCQLTFQL
jgi:hypothetical protein